MTPAVIATALGKRYRNQWGLRDCNLEIPQGRVAALVGRNGAGKSTLLHLATGLLRPTAGTVSVLGRTPDRDVDLLPDIGKYAPAEGAVCPWPCAGPSSAVKKGGSQGQVVCCCEFDSPFKTTIEHFSGTPEQGGPLRCALVRC